MSSFKVVDTETWESILADLDRKENNAARRYRRHNISLEYYGDKAVFQDVQRLSGTLGLVEYNDCYNFLDVIEDDRLHFALKKLDEVELKIIIFRFEQRMQISEIAHDLDRGISTISERLERIINKITRDMEVAKSGL